jgi:hypothetical protein
VRGALCARGRGGVGVGAKHEVWKKARCGRTACEEAVFGEDCYGIDEEHGNCGEC